VKVGSWVVRGQVIAYSGSTGQSTGPHIHYEIHHNGKLLNPANYR
jgi:murein DD-endopeptidase MepM/ murein hydrolase activator NlpD